MAENTDSVKVFLVTSETVGYDDSICGFIHGVFSSFDKAYGYLMGKEEMFIPYETSDGTIGYGEYDASYADEYDSEPVKGELREDNSDTLRNLYRGRKREFSWYVGDTRVNYGACWGLPVYTIEERTLDEATG